MFTQRVINRLTYGDRDDPYRIISRLGERLEATLIPDALLPTVVETVAQALIPSTVPSPSSLARDLSA